MTPVIKRRKQPFNNDATNLGFADVAAVRLNREIKVLVSAACGAQGGIQTLATRCTNGSNAHKSPFAEQLWHAGFPSKRP